MNKLEKLSKLHNYSGYLVIFFLLLGSILLGLVAKNIIPAAISFACFALFAVLYNILESYIYYRKLDLKKGQRKGLLVSFIFEIIFWVLIFGIFLVTLFLNPSFICKLIFYISIIVSSFLSMFFAELENCKHDRVLKISICIFYTIGLILLCAKEL